MSAQIIVAALEYSLVSCCIVAVVLNLIVIAVLAGTKSLRLKYYGFIFNLALSDLGVAAFSLCYRIPDLKVGIRRLIVKGMIHSCILASVLTILAVAINRYLALSLMPPARYDALVTPCRLVGACVVIWCLSLAMTLPLILAPLEAQLVLNGLYVPVILITAMVVVGIVYYLAFRKIRRYRAPLAASPGVGPFDPSQPKQVDVRVRQTRRLLVTFTAILLASFVCWTPSCVTLVMRYFNPTLPQLPTIYGITTLLYYLSPVINPVIYWGRLDGFRQGFYALFCRCCVKTEHGATEVGDDHGEAVAETVM